MSFGLHDNTWVEPDPEPDIPCEHCQYWEPSPCGCGEWGWCHQNEDFYPRDYSCS